MFQRVEESMGQGPPPFQLKKYESYIEVFRGTKLCVFAPKTGIDFLVGNHHHYDYEFFIPIFRPFPMKAEKKEAEIKPSYCYPLNPDQGHGASTPTVNSQMMTMFIQKEFLCEISRMIFGRDQVYFHNDNYKIDSHVQTLIRSFMEESIHCQAGFEFIMESLSTQIAINILRQLKSNMPEIVQEKSYSDRQNINRAIEFLTANYNQSYSLDDVAKVANLSPYHFIRVFKVQMGKTPYDFVLEMKIEKAKEMLRFSDSLVTEICYMCGFNNPSHFATVFKRKVGCLPTEYRKNFIVR